MVWSATVKSEIMVYRIITAGRLFSGKKSQQVRGLIVCTLSHSSSPTPTCCCCCCCCCHRSNNLATTTAHYERLWCSYPSTRTFSSWPETSTTTATRMPSILVPQQQQQQQSSSSLKNHQGYTAEQKHIMEKCRALHASIMPLNEKVGSYRIESRPLL